MSQYWSSIGVLSVSMKMWLKDLKLITTELGCNQPSCHQCHMKHWPWLRVVNTSAKVTHVKSQQATNSYKCRWGVDPLLHSNTSTITPSVTSNCNSFCSMYMLHIPVCFHLQRPAFCTSKFSWWPPGFPGHLVFELQATCVKLLDSFKLHRSPMLLLFSDFTDKISKLIRFVDQITCTKMQPNTGDNGGDILLVLEEEGNLRRSLSGNRWQGSWKNLQQPNMQGQQIRSTVFAHCWDMAIQIQRERRLLISYDDIIKKVVLK